MNTVPTVRWKLIRKTLIGIRHFARGWHFHFANPEIRTPRVPAGWHIIGEFRTAIRHRPELGEQNRNRIANMKKASQTICGMQLEPGQVFSLKRVIGEPSADRGYLPGPVILNGKLRSSTGGGLCQISTTLFNAALLANLNILEKHNHSADIWGEQRMVDLGKDATYAYLRKDLIFRNPFKSAVNLQIEVLDDCSGLRCRIWSSVTNPYTVSIRHRILSEHPRFVIQTERVVKNAEDERINFKRTDYYEKNGSFHRDSSRTD
jgi:vancomycin resistance protein VanW